MPRHPVLMNQFILRYILEQFFLQKWKLCYVYEHVWESVHWARNKCLLSLLTGVCIKRVEFKDNV